jgi:hypothetical protein
MFWGVDFNFDLALPKLPRERAAALTSEFTRRSNKLPETPDFDCGGNLFTLSNERAEEASDWRHELCGSTDRSNHAE